MNRNLLRTALPIASDGSLKVDQLLALHRTVFGDTRMAEDDDADKDKGDEDHDDDADKDKGDEDHDDDADKDKGDEDPKLGEAGQKALERMKERSKRDRARVRELQAENDQLKAGKKTEDKDAPDAEQIRAEARKAADAEILRERVLDKIEAKAGGRFSLDPEDVAAMLLRRKSIDDFLDGDNKIDADAIAEALDDLLKEKPTLAATDGKRFKGGGDQGRKKDEKPKPKSLEEAIGQRLARSKT